MIFSSFKKGICYGNIKVNKQKELFPEKILKKSWSFMTSAQIIKMLFRLILITGRISHPSNKDNKEICLFKHALGYT